MSSIADTHCADAMDAPSIDVKDLIKRYSVEELNRAAEEYFARLDNWDRLLAKPFASSNDAIHLLVQFSYLLQGLELHQGMRIVDFGAGPGWASRILNQMGFEVISLDVSRTALRIGAELAQRHRVFGAQPPHRFLAYDGHRIDLPDKSIDRVFCLDAFHHVPDQHAVLAEMSRILRIGGIAGFAEPGPAHSKDPSSQLEMRNFKVIENDIVLEDIRRLAQRTGFTEMKLAIGSTYPLRVSPERFVRFPDDPRIADEFLRSTADRIRNFPIFFLHKGRSEVDDSRDMAGVTAEIETPESLTVSRGSPIVIRATFRNVSTKRWLPSGASPGSVNIGYFVHDLGVSEDRLAIGVEYRHHLSDHGVGAGERVHVVFELGSRDVGRYRVDIDLVSENVRWFQANGSKIASVLVTVV